MGIVFATCDVKRAMGFINKMYPNHKDITEEDIPQLVKLINQDVVRVQDPDFHRPCQIIAGRNYAKEYSVDVADAIAELKNVLAIQPQMFSMEKGDMVAENNRENQKGEGVNMKLGQKVRFQKSLVDVYNRQQDIDKQETLKFAKENGWKSQKYKGEWEDVCPECQEEEHEKIQV